jgi:hypothetical protein
VAARNLSLATHSANSQRTQFAASPHDTLRLQNAVHPTCQGAIECSLSFERMHASRWHATSCVHRPRSSLPSARGPDVSRSQHRPGAPCFANATASANVHKHEHLFMTVLPVITTPDRAGPSRCAATGTTRRLVAGP